MPLAQARWDRWTGLMFIADQITLETGFPAVCARLERLAGGGLLLRASKDAYGEGITELLRAGPVRYLPGMWDLAEVRLGELAAQDDVAARLPLRWETAGAAGGRFPVLDADITLTAAGEYATVLALTGSYRPPSGLAAAGLDREVVRRCAAGTIRSFLARLACAIAHPAGWAEPGNLAI
jgi:hypothetical protein